MDDRERLRAVRNRQAQTGEPYDVALRAIVAAEQEARELLLEAGRKAHEGKGEPGHG